MSKKIKEEKRKWMDSSLPVAKRVELLMGEMTLEEKVGQMGASYFGDFVEARQQSFDPNLDDASAGEAKKDKSSYNFNPKKMQEVIENLGYGLLQNYIWHYLDDPRVNAGLYVDLINKAQKYLLEKTRLGIPAIITSEAVHGHWAPDSTVFPHSIAVAGSWDPSLVFGMAEIAGMEARIAGVSQVFSPVLDIAREPRWSRMQETYGEDPYLVEQMSVAFIKGMQGEGPFVDDRHCAATAKHFAGHGSPEGGINRSPMNAGKREMKAVHLRPFEAAVKKAGVLSVMPSYNNVDGVPLMCHREYITNVLRQEWGFSGYTYSDWGGVGWLKTRHFVAPTFEDAAKMALEAGVDVDAPVLCYGNRLVKMVKEGRIAMSFVDEAVRRILTLKFILRLFENPYGDAVKAKKIRNCKKHRDFARKVAQESIVLLKNEGQVLPIGKKIKSIAVIGPNAEEVQLGDYSAKKYNLVTPLEAIRKRAPEGVSVRYAKGCELWGLDRSGFAEAVEVARKSDMTVLVMGESKDICNEGKDTHDIRLPGVQEELVSEIASAGKPVVLVLVNGRHIAMEQIVEKVDAIVETWFAGEEQGEAIAGILWGDVNPSGKLPVSLPRTVGHLPSFYSYMPSARAGNMPGTYEKPGRDYIFSPRTPLFEFGFGLSYTEFKYSSLKVTPASIAPAGRVDVSVKVKNAGKREGAEVVQLYVNDVYSSVETPVKQLKGFEKVWLKPGEERTVNFTLGPEELSFVNLDMEWEVEPGEFEVMVAGLKKSFTVVK